MPNAPAINAQVKTPLFRGAFVNAVKPKQNDAGQDVYGFVMLFPKDNAAALMPFRKACIFALEKKWPDRKKWPAPLRDNDLMTWFAPTGMGWPLHDGDLVEYDGYPGHCAISVSSRDPFPIINPMSKEITDDHELSKVVSGIMYRAAVNASAYDHKGKKGVSFWAQLLQWCKDDGVRFGGRVSIHALGDFEDESGSEDAGNYKPSAGNAEDY